MTAGRVGEFVTKEDMTMTELSSQYDVYRVQIKIKAEW